MAKVSRNAPCPCGSGHKYKQCCARSEPSAAATKRHFLADAAASHEWQADIFPLPIDFEDQPQARPTSLLVTAGGFVLHTDMLIEPLGEADAIAGMLGDAIEHAAAAVGGFPHAVAVRWPDVAEAVQRQFGERTTVRCRAFLEELEEPARALVANIADSPHWPTVSVPDSWLSWGLPRPLIAELFDAAADFHAAAPWRWLADVPPVHVELPGARAWTVAVMGSGGREFGLTMFEQHDDYRRSIAGDDPRAVFRRMVGRVIGFGFISGTDRPAAVRREVAAHRWRIASPRAYPLLMPINTPAGGIAHADAHDLLALLRAVPAFALEHADALAADGPIDLHWPHEPTGAILYYMDNLRLAAWGPAAGGDPDEADDDDFDDDDIDDDDDDDDDFDDDDDDFDDDDDDFEDDDDDDDDVLEEDDARAHAARLLSTLAKAPWHRDVRPERTLPPSGTPEAAAAVVARACAAIDAFAKRDGAVTPMVTEGAKLLVAEYARLHEDELSRAYKPEAWAGGALLAAFRFRHPGARTAAELASAFDVSGSAVNVRSRKLARAVWLPGESETAQEESADARAGASGQPRLRERRDATLLLWPEEDAEQAVDAERAADDQRVVGDAVVLPFRRRGGAAVPQPAARSQPRSGRAAPPEKPRKQKAARGRASGAGDDHPRGEASPAFTQVQGQYLTFIHYYTKVHRVPPSERDMQEFFRVSPPSVHNMVKTLEKKGLIARVPGEARTIRVLVPRELLPELE